jgi:hypothetical protein
MLRYLRIAVTVVSLTACVVFSALWVRSYWWLDGVVRDQGPDVISIVTEPGGIVIEHDFYPANEVKERWNFVNEALPEVMPPSALPRRAFAWQKHAQWSAVFVPYWCPVFLTAGIAAAPWVRWSRGFSVRAFLIAATLFAVVLGLIARPR